MIKLDEPLVSMETAKAVVEVPSPFSGKVLKLSGGAGDIIPTGSVLASFELDPNLPQRADGQDTGHSHSHAAPSAPTRRRCLPQPHRWSRKKPNPPLPSVTTPVPWSARCRLNAVHAEQALAVGGVRPCRPCVRWRASWAWT